MCRLCVSGHDPHDHPHDHVTASLGQLWMLLMDMQRGCSTKVRTTHPCIAHTDQVHASNTLGNTQINSQYLPTWYGVYLQCSSLITAIVLET